MKDQYFGDVHDYHKYGLLRALQATGNLSLLVAWLLTPSDGGGDGRQRAYLQEPGRWRQYDPPLYDFLTEALASDATPAVAMIDRSSMLPRTRYFSKMVPDERSARSIWGDRLLECAAGADLVFLDPDNGLEIRSRPIGRKYSSKYAAWSEVERLWAAGSSLLVYQHKRMEKTDITVERLGAEIGRRTGSAFIEVFDAPDVLYFLVAQPRHSGLFRQAIADHLGKWSGRIKVRAQTRGTIVQGDGDMLGSARTAGRHAGDYVNMTREWLLATAGGAEPVIRALLALEGEQGIFLLPRKRCVSLRVDADGDKVPMLSIFAAGVWFAPGCPCLYIDGNVLRDRRGQGLLDEVRARLAGDGLWRLHKVDMQCALDRSFSEGEVDAVVGFVRWLRDQISKSGGAV